MKNILIFFLLSLPNFINASCSYFEPIDNFDRSKGPRVWYAVRRYKNGAESKTTCQILDITKLEVHSKKLYMENGTSVVFTRNTTKESSCRNGKIIVKKTKTDAAYPYPGAAVMVTYINYELNIMVVRACFNNKG